MRRWEIKMKKEGILEAASEHADFEFGDGFGF